MNTLFTNQNTAHLIELFLWMLGAFILGWLLSRIFSSKREKIVEKKVIVEKKIYVDKIIYRDKDSRETTTEKSALPITEKLIVIPKTKPITTVIPSIQEREDSASNTATETTGLNFASFGKALASDKDDLKRISGIGPAIEKKLNGIGIFTYQQISKFVVKDMTDITDLITFFPGRIERDHWVQQAKNLVKGIDTDFSKRVDKGDIY